MSKKSLLYEVSNRDFTRNYFKNFVPNFDDCILKPHNQEVYCKILNGYSKGNKVLFEQATGTGKSYIVYKLLKDHAVGKRVLYVTPLKVIEDAFIKNYHRVLGDVDIQLDTCLYAGLHNYTNQQYDIIIFDEAHRMGAKNWSLEVEKLLNNNSKAKILGMSATLDRNDGVDVRRFFDGKKPVSTLTLVQALEANILHKPDYTLAKVDFGDDNRFIDSCISDFNKKLKTATNEERKIIFAFLERLRRAKQEIAQCNDIAQIFASELTTDKLKKRKFIVFCPAGEEDLECETEKSKMINIMRESKHWFKGVAGLSKVKRYSVYSKYGEKKNKNIIEAFEKDDSKSIKLLFAINMLNEGLHVDGVDGVIMLRNTSSRTVYLQQLGRALSVSSKGQSKIFDFVANLNYIDVQELRTMVQNINQRSLRGFENHEYDSEEEKNLQFKLTISNLETLQFIDLLKKNIFTYQTRFSYKFEDFYARVVAYKNRHNNLNIKSDTLDVDGYPLGSKIGLMKQGSIHLSEKEKQSLLDLGLSLAKREFKFVFEFEDFYTRIVNYKKRNNHLNIKSEEFDLDGYPIGRKIVLLKNKSIKVTDEQRQRLLDFGLDLEIKDRSFDFIGFYNRLLKYKLRNGHLNIKYSDSDVDGYPLGQKINNIKINRVKLGECQLQMLIDLGLSLQTRNREHRYNFADFYNRLESYKMRKGDLKIKYKELDLDGYPLWQKVKDVKQNRIKITEEERQKLIDLGLNLQVNSKNFYKNEQKTQIIT